MVTLGGSDLLKARERDSHLEAHLCPLLIMTAVLLSDSHLFQQGPPYTVRHSTRPSSPAPKQWCASSGSYPRGFARKEELAGTHCSPRLSETSLRPVMTVPEDEDDEEQRAGRANDQYFAYK